MCWQFGWWLPGELKLNSSPYVGLRGTAMPICYWWKVSSGNLPTRTDTSIRFSCAQDRNEDYFEYDFPKFCTVLVRRNELSWKDGYDRNSRPAQTSPAKQEFSCIHGRKSPGTWLLRARYRVTPYFTITGKMLLTGYCHISPKMAGHVRVTCPP